MSATEAWSAAAVPGDTDPVFVRGLDDDDDVEMTSPDAAPAPAPAKEDDDEEIGGLDDAASADEVITLISADGVKVETTKRIVLTFSPLKKALTIGETEFPVPIFELNLRHLLRFAELALEKGMPRYPEGLLPSSRMQDLTQEWAAEWVEKEVCRNGDATMDELCTIIHDTNFLDIKPALHLLSAKMATLIKGQRPEILMELMAPTSLTRPRSHQAPPDDDPKAMTD